MAKILIWVDWKWQCPFCEQSIVQKREGNEAASSDTVDWVLDHLRTDHWGKTAPVHFESEHHYQMIPAYP
jgi:hypothetical protein